MHWLVLAVKFHLDWIYRIHLQKSDKSFNDASHTMCLFQYLFSFGNYEVLQ